MEGNKRVAIIPLDEYERLRELEKNGPTRITKVQILPFSTFQLTDWESNDIIKEVVLQIDTLTGNNLVNARTELKEIKSKWWYKLFAK